MVWQVQVQVQCRCGRGTAREQAQAQARQGHMHGRAVHGNACETKEDTGGEQEHVLSPVPISMVGPCPAQGGHM